MPPDTKDHSIKESLEIIVKTRRPGKGTARQLRRKKWIPSVLYGPNRENKNVSVSEMDVIKYSPQKYENTIFTLKISEDPKINNTQVLKKDIVLHPVTKRPIHIDFYAIDKTKAVRVKIELQFTGKAAGEKEGGIFSALRRDIEVECLPSEIPKSFKVDIQHLEIDDVVHVSDIKIPQGIKLITDQKETVATVSLVQEETKTTSESQDVESADPTTTSKVSDAKTKDQKTSEIKASPSKSSKPKKEPKKS